MSRVFSKRNNKEDCFAFTALFYSLWEIELKRGISPGTKRCNHDNHATLCHAINLLQAAFQSNQTQLGPTDPLLGAKHLDPGKKGLAFTARRQQISVPVMVQFTGSIDIVLKALTLKREAFLTNQICPAGQADGQNLRIQRWTNKESSDQHPMVFLPVPRRNALLQGRAVSARLQMLIKDGRNCSFSSKKHDIR